MEYSDVVISIVEQVIDEVCAPQPMKEVNNPQTFKVGKDTYHLDSIPADKVAEMKNKIAAQNRNIDNLSQAEKENRAAQNRKFFANQVEQRKKDEADYAKEQENK